MPKKPMTKNSRAGFYKDISKTALKPLAALWSSKHSINSIELCIHCSNNQISGTFAQRFSQHVLKTSMCWN